MTEQQPGGNTTNILLFVLILVIAVPSVYWVFVAGNPWLGTALAIALVVLGLWLSGKNQPPRPEGQANPKDRPWLR